jgi:hypothetical protein
VRTSAVSSAGSCSDSSSRRWARGPGRDSRGSSIPASTEAHSTPPASRQPCPLDGTVAAWEHLFYSGRRGPEVFRAGSAREPLRPWSLIRMAPLLSLRHRTGRLHPIQRPYASAESAGDRLLQSVSAGSVVPGRNASRGASSASGHITASGTPRTAKPSSQGCGAMTSD